MSVLIVHLRLELASLAFEELLLRRELRVEIGHLRVRLAHRAVGRRVRLTRHPLHLEHTGHRRGSISRSEHA